MAVDLWRRVSYIDTKLVEPRRFGGIGAHNTGYIS